MSGLNNVNGAHYWPQTAADLLTDDITYAGWHLQTGRQKAFYIRGVTWFRTNVEDTVQNLGVFAPQMQALVGDRSTWHPELAGKDEPYSLRQAYDALKYNGRAPLKYTKAVQTLALCEAAALARHGEDFVRDHFYGLVDTPSGQRPRMRIEAAVSYIHDFDAAKLKELTSLRPSFLADVTAAVGQKSVQLINDMSVASKNVTYRLCCQVRDYIVENFPTVAIGEIEFTLAGPKRYGVSEHEYVN